MHATHSRASQQPLKLHRRRNGSKQPMTSRPEAIKIRMALQLWHRISQGITNLIFLIARGVMVVVMLVVMLVAMVVVMLIAIGLRRAGDRQTAWLAYRSEAMGTSATAAEPAARARLDK